MNSKGKKNSYVVWHILVIVWMIVIFVFSAQPGDTSSDVSGGVSYMLVSLVNRLFSIGWEEAQLIEIVEMIGYPVRKLAHMTEFGILSLLIFGAAGAYEKIRNGKWRFIVALSLTFLYAGADEIHQLFVPDRYGCFQDVLIDTSGAVIALTFPACIMAILKKKTKYRKR